VTQNIPLLEHFSQPQRVVNNEYVCTVNADSAGSMIYRYEDKNY